MIKLKKMSNELQNGNIGFFFVFFDQKADISKFKKFFKSYLWKNRSKNQIETMGLANWVI